MRNIDIFHSLHKPHTSRIVEGFDSVNSGSCSIGTIKGQYRQLNAIVTECATDADQWRIVNLKGQINQVPAFDSVAVLGAVDDDQASALAQLQFGRMFDASEDDVIETNVNGLLRHLATPHFHKHSQLIRRHHLTALQDVPCAVVPGWDGIELTTHEGKTANLLLDMQRHDDQSGLLSSFDGLAQLLESIGAEYADFDSIIVEYQYLDKLMNMLHKAMQTASKGGVKVLKVDQSDKPFRHKKVLNVAVSYDFEDGQTITILFHHPDRDAKRIAPQDTLLSWKILMNNRDVTGVIQPNQGEGIALPVLAGRVVKLINQNSARFKRTQVKKAASAQALADAEQRIAEKQNQKSALEAEIQGLLGQLDNQQQKPTTEPENSLDHNDVSDPEVTKNKDEVLLQQGFNGIQAQLKDIGWVDSSIVAGVEKTFTGVNPDAENGINPNGDFTVSIVRHDNFIVAQHGADTTIKSELLPQYGVTAQTEENYQAIAKKLNDAVEQWVAGQVSGNNEPEDFSLNNETKSSRIIPSEFLNENFDAALEKYSGGQQYFDLSLSASKEYQFEGEVTDLIDAYDNVFRYEGDILVAARVDFKFSTLIDVDEDLSEPSDLISTAQDAVRGVVASRDEDQPLSTLRFKTQKSDWFSIDEIDEEDMSEFPSLSDLEKQLDKDKEKFLGLFESKCDEYIAKRLSEDQSLTEDADLYKSIIDGKINASVELLEQVRSKAKENLDDPLLIEAVNILITKVNELVGTEQA